MISNTDLQVPVPGLRGGTGPSPSGRGTASGSPQQSWYSQAVVQVLHFTILYSIICRASSTVPCTSTLVPQPVLLLLLALQAVQGQQPKHWHWHIDIGILTLAHWHWHIGTSTLTLAHLHWHIASTLIDFHLTLSGISDIRHLMFLFLYCCSFAFAEDFSGFGLVRLYRICVLTSSRVNKGWPFVLFYELMYMITLYAGG